MAKTMTGGSAGGKTTKKIFTAEDTSQVKWREYSMLKKSYFISKKIGKAIHDYNMIEDKNSAVQKFEDGYFYNKIIYNMSKNWSPQEKKVVFLRHGMLDYLDSKGEISPLTEVVEYVHQLFKKNVFC